MNTSFVLAVALSVAVVLVILLLAAALVYCRWRNSELMTSLGEFIRQNLKQQEMIEELKRELEKKQSQSASFVYKEEAEDQASEKSPE